MITITTSIMPATVIRDSYYPLIGEVQGME